MYVDEPRELRQFCTLPPTGAEGSASSRTVERWSFLDSPALYPGPSLKKSPSLMGLHLPSLCCGQDVIIVVSVFPQNNKGACLC